MEKKRKYQSAVEELRASITPLVCSTDGALHVEYEALYRRLASCLARKWDRPYSVVKGWVKIRSQFAIIRSVDLRLRGTRRKIHGFGIHDGVWAVAS